MYSTYNAQNTMKHFANLILIKPLRGKYYHYHHFSNKKTES